LTPNSRRIGEVDLDLTDVCRVGSWLFLMGDYPWNGDDLAGDLGCCPVCRGERLRGSRYCLRCDRSGLDSKIEFPGLPIGYALDPSYGASEPTVCAPDPRLAGGVEGKSRKRCRKTA
jgi:hypothetical protein